MITNRLKNLLYSSTILLTTILIALIYFASNLNEIESKCKRNLLIFNDYEKVAWNIIRSSLDEMKRMRRETYHYTRNVPLKKRKHKNKRKIGNIRVIPKILKQFPVKGAHGIAELDEENINSRNSYEDSEDTNNSEYSNSDSEQSNENVPKVLEDSEDSELDIPNPPSLINTTINNITIAENGTAYLLEVHNDKEDEDEDTEANDKATEDRMMTMKMMEEDEESDMEEDEYDMDNPCPRGPPGPPGVAGEPGDDADDGSDGNDGAPWHLEIEDRVIVLGCVKCPPGPRGVEGDPGPPGDLGGPGADGNPGLDGYEGFPGSAGEQGPPGEDGEPGYEGWPGPSGITSQRYYNLPGPPGPPGPVGPPGDIGEPGDSSPSRNAGLTGVPGAPGKHGVPGPPGAPGAPGEPGIDSHIGTDRCPCPERKEHGGGGGGGYAVAPPVYSYHVPYQQPYEQGYQYYETTTPYRYFVHAEYSEATTMTTTVTYPNKYDTTTEEYKEGNHLNDPPTFGSLADGPPQADDKGVEAPAIPTNFDTNAR